MKRGLFVLSFAVIMIATMGFVSAQLSELLNSLDPTMVWLFAIFIISFVLLFFSLNRMLKNNTAIAGIISVVLAFLITYSVNQTGLDVSGFFYDLGVSEDLLAIVLPIIIIAASVVIAIKLKKNSLFVFGGLFIVASFLVYEKIVLIVIGIILLVIGLVLTLAKKKKKEIRIGF